MWEPVRVVPDLFGSDVGCVSSSSSEIITKICFQVWIFHIQYLMIETVQDDSWAQWPINQSFVVLFKAWFALYGMEDVITSKY